MSFKFSFHALKIKDTFQDVVGGENLNIRTKVCLLYLTIFSILIQCDRFWKTLKVSISHRWEERYPRP
jgi:hypothetical protein